ncbi:hypothetical protein [Nitrococcus mobilis]|uniref:hypothetical protein n=1 Tax=Nitrococcus mobilis TaxID=35797 RepID=UPI0002F9613A|nr:hypothetical protein [Nitrococcus mobilis]
MCHYTPLPSLDLRQGDIPSPMDQTYFCVGVESTERIAPFGEERERGESESARSTIEEQPERSQV